MRCSRCGRLPEGEAPKWAFHCVCDPCVSCRFRDSLQDDRSGCLEEHDCSALADWRIAHDEGRLPAPPPHPCGECDPERHMDCVFSSGMPDCDALRLWLAHVDMTALVEAVRSDKVVGRGTCSRIDECLEDADLRRELALAGCSTVEAAVKWARDDEHLFLEQGLNQRWGEDDDPQLADYRAFQEADKRNPV